MNSLSCAATLSVSFRMARDFSRISGGVSGLLGNHLRQSADDVERVARFMSETCGGKIHFLEMCGQFTGAHKAQLQIGRLHEVAPAEPRSDY